MMEFEIKELPCTKLHKKTVANAVTTPPIRTSFISKIEKRSHIENSIVPSISEHLSCFYKISQFICFRKKIQAHPLNNSEVYQSTTEPLFK